MPKTWAITNSGASKSREQERLFPVLWVRRDSLPKVAAAAPLRQDFTVGRESGYLTDAGTDLAFE